MINARFIVDTFKVSDGTELHQVLIALVVHGQQRQVIARLILSWVAVVTTPRRHVGFDADDWLNTSTLGCFITLNDARHRAMVSDSTSFHAELLYSGDHVRNFG